MYRTVKVEVGSISQLLPVVICSNELYSTFPKVFPRFPVLATECVETVALGLRAEPDRLVVGLTVHGIGYDTHNLLQAVAAPGDRSERIFRVQAATHQRWPGGIAFHAEQLGRVGHPHGRERGRALPKQRTITCRRVLAGSFAHLPQGPARDARRVDRGAQGHVNRPPDLQDGLLAHQRRRGPAAEGHHLDTCPSVLDAEYEAAGQLARGEVVGLLEFADTVHGVRQPDAAQSQVGRHGIWRNGGSFDAPLLVLAGVTAHQGHAWPQRDLAHAQANHTV